MDSKIFANFLKKRLLEEADGYNEILYSLTYRTLEEGHRTAGRRETLVAIADSLENLLKEFYDRSN
jgi:hypothetical protein